LQIFFREEDEYKARLKVAEDAQQAATVRRKVNKIVYLEKTRTLFSLFI